MTRDRDSRDRREGNEENSGVLSLKRKPGEDILIMLGEELLVNIHVESMKADRSGPVLVINAAEEQFLREEIDKNIFLRDRDGEVIFITGEADPVNNNTAIVMIGAPRRYMILRRELWEAQQLRLGKAPDQL